MSRDVAMHRIAGGFTAGPSQGEARPHAQAGRRVDLRLGAGRPWATVGGIFP
jgi:hypothetical protein